MPYIPQFNKISLQEMAYAPQLMRQQHDDAIARNMEISEALKFDYLNQDAKILEPKLQKYSSDVEAVANDLATKGFSHDTRNKIIGLKSQFGSDEEIRNIKKNYAQAMSGWEETKKGLIAGKASGQQIAQQKKAYFDPEVYKGAYDDDGFYQEFTPGATSGIYDIAEETKKAMTGIGETGSIVGKEGTSMQRVEATASTPAHFRITDSRTGQIITTTDQIDAVKKYIKTEFDPNNNMSDKGLYSKISGITPDYINNLVDQVGGSMVSTKYGQLPGSTTNIQFDPRTASGSDKDKQPSSMPSYQVLELNKERYDKAEKSMEILNTPIPNKDIDFKGIREADPFSQSGFNPYSPVGAPSVSSEKQRVIKELKGSYPGLFNNKRSEEESAKLALEYERAYSGMQNTLIGLKSPQVAENIVNSIYNPTDEQTLERIGDKGSKKIKTMSDLALSYKDTGIDWKGVPPLVDYKGDIYVRGVDDGLYKINDNALDKHTRNIKKTINPIMNQLTDPSLFDKDGDVPVNIPGTNLSLHVVGNESGDPYNINDRYVEIVRKTANGNYDRVQVMQPGEVFQNLVEGIRTDIQTYVK